MSKCFFIILFFLNVFLGAETYSDSGAVTDYVNSGNQYLDSGAYELAIRKYQSALQVDSHYRPAWRKIGDAYRFLNNPKAAIDAYIQFVTLSTDTSDNEGKELLFETAKIAYETMHDPDNAIRALDGLLSFYYSGSLDSIQETIHKYRDVYLETMSTLSAKSIKYGLVNIDSFWEKVMLYKAKLLVKENRKKEAFVVYSQCIVQARYIYQCASPDIGYDEWFNLYKENMLETVPHAWIACPWVIELSPDRNEYGYTRGENKVFEDTIRLFTADDNIQSGWFIFQAKPGYRISKLTLRAEIDIDKDSPQGKDIIFPFDILAMIPKPVYKEGVQIPSFTTKGKRTVTETMEFENGIRVAQFLIQGNSSMMVSNIAIHPKCYQWNLKAELTLESDMDKQTLPKKLMDPRLIIDIQPFVYPKISIDDGRYVIESTNATFYTPKYLQAGQHKMRVEHPDYPTEEIHFYWDAENDTTIHIFLSTQWTVELTNLIFPEKSYNLKIVKDKAGVYRLLLVAGYNEQSDIYASSSRDLVHWTPLERLSINGWTYDQYPNLVQDYVSGEFHLIWQSDRARDSTNRAREDIWESTSSDFLNWTRPNKILTVNRLYSESPSIGLSLFPYKSQNYHLFYTGGYWGYSDSIDGKVWSEPGKMSFSPPIDDITLPFFYGLLSNGQFLAVYNNQKDAFYFYTSQDGKKFVKQSTLNIDNRNLINSSKYDLVELKKGEYGFMIDQTRKFLYKTKDFKSWSEPTEILHRPLFSPPFSDSNIINDDINRFVFFRNNGELWSASEFK